MEYSMVRTFDHAGYYETRLILMLITLGIAIYKYRFKGDRRFLIIFASGALLLTVTEYLLQLNGLRGAGYNFSLFGIVIRGIPGPMLQGLLEGGSCGLIAFWFADQRSAQAKRREWVPFGIVCVIVVVLSIVAGYAARPHPVSSSRQMFSTVMVFYATTIIFVSLVIAWRRDAISDFVNFFGGLLLYALLSLEPLHILGVRFIGTITDSQVHPASVPIQAVLMLLSHVYEIAGARLHIFIIPALLGLVALREKKVMESGERYSTQHLLDLAQRGWRRRSKPFQKEKSP